jgi:hypothetical protein
MTPRRALRAQYPYEARIVGGKVMMPAELQRLHRDLLDPSRLDVISDDMRRVVEELWPELVHKLPARRRLRSGRSPGTQGAFACNRS